MKVVMIRIILISLCLFACAERTPVLVEALEFKTVIYCELSGIDSFYTVSITVDTVIYSAEGDFIVNYTTSALPIYTGVNADTTMRVRFIWKDKRFEVWQ